MSTDTYAVRLSDEYRELAESHDRLLAALEKIEEIARDRTRRDAGVAREEIGARARLAIRSTLDQERD